MFLQLIVTLFFTSASADDNVAVISQKFEETKIVEEFEQVCENTGYVIKGITWSSCNKNKTTVSGCIIPSGQKIKFGETYVDGRAKFSCVMEGDMIYLIPVACVFNGIIHGIGSTFLYKKFYYQCVSFEDHSIAVKPFACSDSNNAIVYPGVEFAKGKFIFRCQYSADNIVQVGVKCISQNGYSYAIGEGWTYNGYAYECLKRGKYSIELYVSGCADPFGGFVGFGGRYITGQAIMQCQEDNNGVLTHKPIGCYAKDHRIGQPAVFLFGQRFYEAYGKKFGYVMECTLEWELIRHKPVSCVYHAESADYYLEVGCAATIKNKIFICQQLDPKYVLILLKKVPQDLNSFLAQRGLRVCDASTSGSY